MIILNLFLIIFSFSGFSLFMKEKLKIDTTFIPFLYVCLISSLVYISALISIMRTGTFIFHIICIVYLIYASRKNKGKIFQLREYGAFLILIMIFFIVLISKEMLHYDNFSHWARISKFLIENNRLNNSNDKYIIFNTYPQMSAYFIYGLFSFFFYTEFTAMLANGLAIFSGYFVLYNKLNKNLVAAFLFFIFAICIIYYNTPINSLLVDTLISTSGFAGIIFVYENNFTENKWTYLLVFPIILYISLIKNSSIYFAAIIVIYLIYKYLSKDIKLVIFSVLSLFISEKSWSYYIKKTFTEFGKHSLDFKSYKINFSLKTIDDIRLIREKFIGAILGQKVIFILFVTLIIILFISNNKKQVGKIILSLTFIYLIYQIGNYYMYLYSMPKAEAMKLASFERYSKTIDLYLLLISIYLFANKSYINIKIVFIALTSLTISTLINYNDEFENQHNIQIKRHLQKSYERIKGKNENILIILKEDKIGYYKYMIGYIFEDEKVDVYNNTNVKSINKADYDYIIDLSK